MKIKKHDGVEHYARVRLGRCISSVRTQYRLNGTPLPRPHHPTHGIATPEPLHRALRCTGRFRRLMLDIQKELR